MNCLLSILLTAILCASASAQTIKTLGFNSTNGQVVANTGTNVLTFTNGAIISTPDDSIKVKISTEEFSVFTAAQDGNVLHIPADDTVQLNGGYWNDPTVRASLGFTTNLNTLWTATNASNARSAVGLGATNAASFQSVITEVMAVGSGTNSYFSADVNMVETALPIEFANNSAAATRTNLGLPLAGLTNTSNVTMMRALSGSTNSSEPYSGTFYVTDPEAVVTWQLTFSNGILLSVIEL